MKKTFILTFALLLAFVVSHAQTEKGTQTVGLNLHFPQSDSKGVWINPFDQSSTSNDNHLNYFGIGPTYSYFIANNLDLGADLNYSNLSESYPPTNSPIAQSNKSYGGSVFLRKYFMYKDKIGLRVGPSLSYTRTNQVTTYAPQQAFYNENSKTNTWDIGAQAALVYYPTKHLGLSAVLAYIDYADARTNSGSQGWTTSKNTYLGFINNGLSLSAFYSFGGK